MGLEEKEMNRVTMGLVSCITLVAIGFTSTATDARSTVDVAQGTRSLWLMLSANFLSAEL